MGQQPRAGLASLDRQRRHRRLHDRVAPDALGTASGFNIAAFNLGISGGSFIGGQLLRGPGLLAAPYASIAMAVVALFIATALLRPQLTTADPNVP